MSYAAKETEAAHQTALFNWAGYQMARFPELELLYHIPNGGKRNAAEAAHLKRQGVKAGVPDICLPVARGDYHGMYLELKVGKNRPTQLQQAWLRALAGQGYYCGVAWGWEAAARAVVEYLTLEAPRDTEGGSVCEWK